MKYFFIILLLASSKLYAQDVSVIYKTDTIFFFGYDFTHFTLAENHVVNDPGRYIFPWIMYISKYSTSYFYEKNLLATVLYDFTYTNSINAQIVKNLSVKKEEEVTSSFPLLYDNNPLLYDNKISYILDSDSLQRIISYYKLEQKEGVGLVAIMKYVNKAKEETLVYFVFFDLKTKRLLKIYESLSWGGGGIGLTTHWGNSFIGNVQEFLYDFIYELYLYDKKEYKRKTKRMRKVWRAS